VYFVSDNSELGVLIFLIQPFLRHFLIPHYNYETCEGLSPIDENDGPMAYAITIKGGNKPSIRA
jgi:hypothetical protein